MRNVRATVAALFDDPQFSQLARQVTALVAAMNTRAFKVIGEALDPQLLLRATSIGLTRSAEQAFTKAATGCVVSLHAAREAREPARVGYITLTPDPAAFEAIDALALREHGEVNAATRSLVLQAALQRGLSPAGG
jgi:hypothetical protein